MDLSLIYFPSAVILGALHALEPGHAKTLTAAYLIGTKGTKRDATILGISVATTHSLVVVALCLVAIFIGRETFTGEASYYLAMGSSLIVIGLGVWLLRKRLRALKRASSIVAHHHHPHAPNPVHVKGNLFDGQVEIVDTPEGERFRVTAKNLGDDARIFVSINRENGSIEKHILIADRSQKGIFTSSNAPAEPHEFSANILVEVGNNQEELPFEMHEPEHHHEEHDHALLSDEEHARAHASNLPDYVSKGERPTVWQIISFGAAGGLVPCPAAVSVMLLSLSLNQSGKGLILVLGFGIGLAITLVGVGLLVVAGISKLSSVGKFARISAYAPLIAAGMVIISGFIGFLSSIIHYS